MAQLNCDGSGPHAEGTVKVMRSGDGNLILCQRCWSNEIKYRAERNKELGEFAKFELPEWTVAKPYLNQ